MRIELGGPNMLVRPRDLADRMHGTRQSEIFTLPIEAARRKAREILDQPCHQVGYMTVVEKWRQLPDGQIEFTMRDLPSADWITSAPEGMPRVKAAFVSQYRVADWKPHNRPPVADRGWERPFDDPIPLPRGRHDSTPLVRLGAWGQFPAAGNAENESWGAADGKDWLLLGTIQVAVDCFRGGQDVRPPARDLPQRRPKSNSETFSEEAKRAPSIKRLPGWSAASSTRTDRSLSCERGRRATLNWRRRGNEMRIFVASLIVLAVLYFWDKDYNNGKLLDGLERMGQQISRNMFH
jgi:hypothetical protein